MIYLMQAKTKTVNAETAKVANVGSRSKKEIVKGKKRKRRERRRAQEPTIFRKIEAKAVRRRKEEK